MTSVVASEAWLLHYMMLYAPVCVQWAERLLPEGHEQWGDKWCETFGDGKGTKHGEVR